MGRCDAESETLIPTGGCFDDAYSIRTANTSSNGWGIQHEVTHTLDQARGLAIAHTLKGEGFDASEDGTGRGTPLIPVDCHGVMPTMLNGANTPAGHMARSGHNKDAYIVSMAVALRGRDGGATAELGDECAFALRASSGGGDEPHVIAFSGQMSVPQCDVELSQTLQAKNPQAALASMAVRRLTPTECERLQGFPDDYTLIPWRTWQEATRKGASYEGLLLSRGMTLRGPSNENCPDGPRYKALGNSWAVPCARWIGQRIDDAIKEAA